jgi:6-phosphogluconolactonase
MEILVGSYSRHLGDIGGNGDGIYSVSVDAETGEFGLPTLLADCVNPTYLTLAPDRQHLFAVREVFAKDQPALLSFRLTSSGALTATSQLEISGELPCHLAYDPVNMRLASAQYWTGDLAICDVKDGVLQAPASALARAGSGPNSDRQQGPHAHFVVFTDDGTILHSADLGSDSIISVRLDAENHPIETVSLPLPAGCGPRHMALTKDTSKAFVVCELDESLIALGRSGLGWEISSVQPGFAAPLGVDGACAAIRLSPDENHVYISGRRQSCIAGFAIGSQITPLGETSTGGLNPRDFIISKDGNWAIVGNQESDTLISLRRDPVSGTLSASGHSCDVGSPVSLVELSD